jgi:hypothetical protein
MNSDSRFHGSCFCGAVKLTATGMPVIMGYCHCESCRHWTGGPITEYTLWSPAQVEVTEGAEHVGTYGKTQRSHRTWCMKCGGHLMTELPGAGLVDIFAPVLPELRFAPSLHTHYGESKIRVTDGLPKFKDLPADFGGSGEMLNE